ncbi:TPA: hypothetical protein IHD39_001727 [Escherichia coli]|nr:hypothetical protein [Escherichia coli]HAO1559841.1 hypothetical protein [Escherichia coli]
MMSTPFYKVRQLASSSGWQLRFESFPQDNPTSDTLKHEVERYNQINHQHSDHPHYIPNGAFIAAMVASGYKVKPAGRMNAFFNISKKGLCAAMGKN